MKGNKLIAKAIRVADELEKQGKNIPILLLSHPGYTKTTTVKMYKSAFDYNLVNFIPARYTSDDVVGFESVTEESKKNSTTKRLKPSWLVELENLAKNGKRNILFIDELSTTPPFIQGPLLDLIFNKTLGEYSLPDNTIIIAGANYADDLDDSVTLLSPMLNRFMIVNILPEDFDFNEICDFDIDTLKTKEDYINYLDIKESKNAIDFSIIKDYIKTIISNKDVTISKYDPSIGQLGFLSVRSLSYSLNFLQTYLSLYDDDLWTRIVGDTLGICSKLEKCYNSVLDAFIQTQRNSKVNILNEILENIKAGKIRDVIQILSTNNIKNFSLGDVAKIKDTILEYSKNINEDDLQLLIGVLSN